MIHKSFVKTARVIQKHRTLFFVLLILQLLFVVLIATINVKYQLAIATNVQNIVEPLQNANYDEDAIKSGLPFLQEAGSLYKNYQEMVSNLSKLISFQLLVFLSIGLILWNTTHLLFKKESFIQNWSQLMIRALTFLVPIAIVDYFVVYTAIKMATETQSTSPLLYVGLFITIVGVYFMFVFLALPFGKYKKRIKEAFFLGIKKFHYIIGVLLLNALFVSLFSYLVSLSIYWDFFIMVVLILLLLITFVFCRIFFVATIQELHQ